MIILNIIESAKADFFYNRLANIADLNIVLSARLTKALQATMQGMRVNGKITD
jgi:hypothetical protein